ncbi:MAG: hypothetical protein V3S00_04695, partial [Dehalococcoidia bacterium]
MPIFLPDIIPLELKSRRQWVAWKWQERDGKLTKPPVNPHTGGPASTTDGATWGTYDEAIQLAQGKRAAGVGFVFTPEDPYVGVDLDKCRDPETSEIEPW